MKFLSLCAGIEAASVALGVLGWQAIALAEIEPFPCAVLAHHYPHVPNLGDITGWRTWPEALLLEVEAVLGGTPCQAFSIAGLRASLGDDRGNLTLTYVEIIEHIDALRARHGRPPLVCLWENVPGVLSTADNAFGCFLGALAGEVVPLTPPGGRWTDAGYVRGPARTIAWRTLDAQYFGLAQRRERVFALASARADFRPEAVLFESGGVRRDHPPRRESGEKPAPTLSARSKGGGGLGTDFDLDGGLVAAVDHVSEAAAEAHPETLDLAIPEPHRHAPVSGLIAADIAPTIDASFGRLQGCSGQDANHGHASLVIGFDCKQGGDTNHGYTENASPPVRGHDGRNAICFDTTQITHPENRSNPQPGDPCHPLTKEGHSPAIAFNLRGRDGGAMPEVDPDGLASQRAASGGSSRSYVATSMCVRRLTPRECERLQGFPDDYTRIPGWSGWRQLDTEETPEDLRAEGLQVKQTKSGRWWVNDPDGPRYKALGNSWAVNVVHWIGTRINAELTFTLDLAAA